MAVIINDFEIEVEASQPSQSRGGGEQSSPQQSKSKPEEITSVVHVNRERMERVRAD
ncbi:MAG: hypothetical protein QOJ76_3145 [Acidobacteriota bacterium]|jgi:hypothetical protein|nr:hypothetical protein [Acidobacteriota bacterium]